MRPSGLRKGQAAVGQRCFRQGSLGAEAPVPVTEAALEIWLPDPSKKWGPCCRNVEEALFFTWEEKAQSRALLGRQFLKPHTWSPEREPGVVLGLRRPGRNHRAPGWSRDAGHETLLVNGSFLVGCVFSGLQPCGVEGRI